MGKSEVIQGILFEDDYIIRSQGTLVTQPEVALIELVANAWDAGATTVKITIPEKHGELLTIEDNGIGLSKEEFHNIWMKLRYDRLRSQGNKVVFPEGIKGNRFAYGRNGIGRHGLLCFNDQYRVKTTKNGQMSIFTLSTNQDGQPLAIVNEFQKSSKGHGTTLEVEVNRNLPQVERIRDIICAKFLHDPQFRIVINNVHLQLDDLSGLISKEDLKVEDANITVTVILVDSKKSIRKCLYQGIAFWHRGRLVGEPSWILGHEFILDGRTSLAKRYNVVVQSYDLEDQINEAWTDFKNTETMQKVYKAISEYLDQKFREIALKSIEETKTSIKMEMEEKLKNVSPLTLHEVDEVIESIAINSPKARQETVIVAVEAVINLQKSKNGEELLAKLVSFTEDDVIGLNELLKKWTVNDALIVLNEIDKRISIIEAIRKLSGDATIDELHILHPLVTEARWLFGHEYDSAEYISNRQLQTIAKNLFKHKKLSEKDSTINLQKRPDLVVLPDNTTISLTGIEDFIESDGLANVGKILLIELKKGGFNITRKERQQTQDYVEDLRKLSGKEIPIIAFLVGESMDITDNVISFGPNNIRKVTVVTYSQLVDTAEKRMFGLRQKLCSMYDDVPGMELYRQLKLPF